MATPVSPPTVSYFYGRISRDEAEQILREAGCQDGLYLLRENMTVAGNYALSICHQSRVHHYSIERQPDGKVMIPEGQKFNGPVELIEHHIHELDGFLTKPLVPCNRKLNQQPMAWPGVTYTQLENALLLEARKRGIQGSNLITALGPQRRFLVAKVAKELHKEQPWFHQHISREEADRVMQQSGHVDGKFLLRERDNGTYALSLSFKNQTKHYKIEKVRQQSPSDNGCFAIEDGPRFDCLMDMVAHYYNKTDGLLCKLSCVCVRPGYIPPITGEELKSNIFYGDLRGFSGLPEEIVTGSWEEPDIAEMPVSSARTVKPDPLMEDSQQKMYDKLPHTDDVFNLKKTDLKIQDTLGGGNFGFVKRGIYTRGSLEIPVAIKTLKQDEVQSAAEELLDEARRMADLKHRHIVRLIGVCKSDMMLVMELAPLGPVNKFLKCRKDLEMRCVLELLYQVAQGMEYLESRNFVHRDLAARNVLLVNERYAKISDFGMSKALGLGNEYYKAETAGKWPLKWYAPECIYYWKFDSKSDVWSYGVTVWEATSYGARPYRGLRGTNILDLIDRGDRLDKPEKCPPLVYDLMLKCWHYDKNERPTFKDIVIIIRRCMTL